VIRLRRMAAAGRVYWQACVSAGPRCQRSSGARRSSVHRASDTFRWPSHAGGLLMSVALVMQPSMAANRAAPIWHVYPKGARREAASIFARCDVAGRGILKDYFQGSCERQLSRQDAGVTKEK
jgi:hypothetical protein